MALGIPGHRGELQGEGISEGEAQTCFGGHPDVKISGVENIQTARHKKRHMKTVKASKCLPHRLPACEQALSVKLRLSTGGPSCFGRRLP